MGVCELQMRFGSMSPRGIFGCETPIWKVAHPLLAHRRSQNWWGALVRRRSPPRLSRWAQVATDGWLVLQHHFVENLRILWCIQNIQSDMVIKSGAIPFSDKQSATQRWAKRLSHITNLQIRVASVGVWWNRRMQFPHNWANRWKQMILWPLCKSVTQWGIGKWESI